MRVNKKNSGWILFVAAFLALLWPNDYLIRTEAATLTNVFESPVLFLWDIVDAILAADPLLIVFCIEVLLFALCKKVWVWWAVHLPFLLWLPIELAYLHRYSGPSSAHIIAIISETNLKEALGYLGSNGVLLGCLYLVFCVWSIWLTRFFKQLDLQWAHRSRIWIILIFAPTLGIYFYGYKDFDSAQKKLIGMDSDLTSYYFSYGANEFFDTYPFGMPLRIFDYFYQNKKLKYLSSELKLVKLNIPRNTGLKDSDETYVVVIGESSRADHWSINGYERETTPLLESTEHVLSFGDAVSAAGATRTAVPVLLSQTTVTDLAFSKFKPSWITAFKENGFKVFWFSMQMPVGTHDTTIGIYANLADEVRYLNAGTYKNITEYDEVLLGALDSALMQKNQKRLIILHTLGSHTPYQRRYPQNFSKFTPDPPKASLPNIFDGKEKAEILNSYDNSIVYTDFMLAEVIRRLKEVNGVKALWYSSDHGQSLYDKNCSSAGHGFFSKYVFHVPVVFWYSKEYEAAFSEKVSALLGNKNKPVYMGDFYSTILDSFGFNIEAAAKKGSFAEPNYQVGKRTVTVDGQKLVDYDKEFSHVSCLK